MINKQHHGEVIEPTEYDRKLRPFFHKGLRYVSFSLAWLSQYGLRKTEQKRPFMAVCNYSNCKQIIYVTNRMTD